MPDEKPASDLRQSRRQRSLLGARIVFNKRSSTLDCTIRDISETGARLSFGHGIDVPPTFDLHIPKTGRLVRAELVWQRGPLCGVRFVGERHEGT
jgi:hypothetical protein